MAIEDEVLPRRRVLRGVLAVGCSVLLPGLSSGCDSGNDTNRSGSPAAKTDSRESANNKASQESVEYQDSPKGNQRCAGCQHFKAESNTCEVVEGQISPEGWCILWVEGS